MAISPGHVAPAPKRTIRLTNDMALQIQMMNRSGLCIDNNKAAALKLSISVDTIATATLLTPS